MRRAQRQRRVAGRDSGHGWLLALCGPPYAYNSELMIGARGPVATRVSRPSTSVHETRAPDRRRDTVVRSRAGAENVLSHKMRPRPRHSRSIRPHARTGRRAHARRGRRRRRREAPPRRTHVARPSTHRTSQPAVVRPRDHPSRHACAAMIGGEHRTSARCTRHQLSNAGRRQPISSAAIGNNSDHPCATQHAPRAQHAFRANNPSSARAAPDFHIELKSLRRVGACRHASRHPARSRLLQTLSSATQRTGPVS